MSRLSKTITTLRNESTPPIVKLYTASLTDVGKEAYEEWLGYYTLIHGKFDTQKPVDFSELEQIYKLKLDDETLFNLLFAIETYYASLMRVIAANIIDPDKLKISNIDRVLDGSYFEEKFIYNYNCDCIYDWYVVDTNLKNDVLVPILKSVTEVDKQMISANLLKDVYESIFPSKIRRGMGEFHTPDWLVDFIVNDILNADPDFLHKKIIDPTCGSGSFLINILNRNNGDPDEISNLFGIDLNPISVLTTKTNLLINLNHISKPIVLQIFQADVIPTPIKSNTRDITSFDRSKSIRFKTKTITVENTTTYDDVLELYLKVKSGEIDPSDFFDLDNNYRLDELYSAISPALLKNLDYVVGNPPWINWEYLPEEYKLNNIDEWNRYKLFAMKGMNKNFIKEDISELITYVSIDRYLKNDGILAFVLKESLLKSSKQAQEFRKFYLENTKTPLSVEKVYDLTQFKPFDAANKTIIMFIKKNKLTIYPVPYIVWKPTGRKKQSPNISKDIVFENMIAKPSVAEDVKSGWITTTEETAFSKEKCLGTNTYRARTGVFTGGANSVFWLKLLDDYFDTILVENITERAIKKVDCVHTRLEKKYVHPMVRGRDLNFWSFKTEQYILCPHTVETKMYPVDINTIAKECPLTYEYLHTFETFLKNRQSFASWEQSLLEKNYHTLQRVGPYTFSKYKVAWRYISTKFITCVIDDDSGKYTNTFIPNEKIIYVGLDNKEEAYYLCGVLSSDQYRKTIESFMVSTQIGPSILDKLNIPSFDPNNSIHTEISKLCYSGHKDGTVEPYLNKINELISIIQM